MPAISKIEDKIKKEKNGCWRWIASFSGNYGFVRINYKGLLAHRVFYEKYKGKIKDGMQIDHLCKKTWCVNPDHLEQVTPAENMHRSSVSFLTKKLVLKLRKEYATGKFIQKELANKYGVGQHQISRIVNRKEWLSI